MFDYFQLSDTTDYQYMLDSLGTDVIINEAATPVKVLITNTNLEQNYDDKKISSLSEFERGDIVSYNDRTFMIISEEVSTRYNKYKGIMRNLPFSITFNSSCVFITQNAYIESQNFGVSSGQVMTLAEASVKVILSDSISVSGLRINNRFMIHGQVFKITGLDRYSRKGMLILSCEKDTLNIANDDLINNVAGGFACPVEITSTPPLSVYIGLTLQIDYTSTNNAPVVFVSSDEDVATVSNTGLVTTVSEGEVTITVKNASNDNITDTIIVTVEPEPVAFSVNITSASTTPNEIKKNQTKIYTAEVYNGVTLITDGSQPVTWSVYADDQTSTTTLASITSQDDTSVIVKNNDAVSGYIQLKCVLDSDGLVYSWRRIQMKALF